MAIPTKLSGKGQKNRNTSGIPLPLSHQLIKFCQQCQLEKVKNK